MLSMTELEIASLRLYNQRVSSPSFAKPEEVVSWLVASQAQDYAGAKWALGLRMRQATDDDVEQAFQSGRILRTHMMRPTWHFVTPADIRWMLALTSPRVHAVNAGMYRQQGLDADTLSRGATALRNALRDGQQLTREELRDALGRAGILAGNGVRLAYILQYAELNAVICSGPRRGKQFTYMLLDERAPNSQSMGRDEALAELVRRYFTSRGPATVHDMAKWSGLTVADIRQGLDAVKSEFREEVVDGQSYWLPASPSTPPVTQPSPSAYLLSIYDEYNSSYKDRSAMSDAQTTEKLIALGSDLQFIVVVDGRVVGTWKRTLAKAAVTVTLNLFVRLTKPQQRAVAQAAERFGAFVGLPVVLVT